MSNFDTYKFTIEGLKVDTLPMDRFSAYIKGLVTLFGHREHVHFHGVEEGSISIGITVDEPRRQQVRDRLSTARFADNAPDDVRKAVQTLNENLGDDHTRARCTLAGDEVLGFPGTTRSPEPPIKQPYSFDGMLIRVGGTDSTVPVHIEEAHHVIHYCNADRDMARKLAPYLFGKIIRVFGDGVWEQQIDKTWKLQRFDIRRFEVVEYLSDEELILLLDESRGKGWDQFDDPVAEAKRLRHE